MRNKRSGVGGLTPFCFSRAQARETIKTWLRHPLQLAQRPECEMQPARPTAMRPWVPIGWLLGSCSRCSVIVRAAEKKPAPGAAQLAAYLLQFWRTGRTNTHGFYFSLGCGCGRVWAWLGTAGHSRLVLCLVHDCCIMPTPRLNSTGFPAPRGRTPLVHCLS